MLPEQELWEWPGDLGCGRSRGAGGKPAHVAQPLPSQCLAAAEHEHEHEHEHAPSVSSAGRENQPSSCAASPQPLCSLRQLTKAICYINADSPDMPPCTFSTPAPKGRGWVQGCVLQGRARPAKPLQTPAAGPLNSLAPKAETAFFYSVNYPSGFISLIPLLSQPDTRISRRKEVSFPVRVINHFTGKGTTWPFIRPEHCASSR